MSAQDRIRAIDKRYREVKKKTKIVVKMWYKPKNRKSNNQESQ